MSGKNARHTTFLEPHAIKLSGHMFCLPPRNPAGENPPSIQSSTSAPAFLKSPAWTCQVCVRVRVCHPRGVINGVGFFFCPPVCVGPSLAGRSHQCAPQCAIMDLFRPSCCFSPHTSEGLYRGARTFLHVQSSGGKSIEPGGLQQTGAAWESWGGGREADESLVIVHENDTVRGWRCINTTICSLFGWHQDGLCKTLLSLGALPV